VLDRLVDGLQKGQTLIVSGKLIRARVQGDGLELHSADGMTKKGLIRGETLRVLESPRLDGTNIEWHLLDAEGFEGLVKAGQTEVTLAAAAEGDTEVSEVVYLADSPTSEEKARTVLDLARPLAFLYDRATVRIHANVAKATHGESKAEVVGGGDSSEANPAFFLKQEPLTNVSASTPSGRESTLEVRVNDILWEEAPSLYAHGPKEQVYTTRLADDGTVEVRFGDGVMGARLPSGIENVKAAYRVGTGLPGMVKANQLSLLMSRPLGVKSVINPLAPTGAADPEPRDQARRNAPFTVLTLDRVVSLRDYEDFARAFAGIGKAQAVELRHGEIRLVHITIAGANGGKVDVTSELHKNLKDALAAQSDKHQPFILESYNPLHFNLEASLRIHHRYQPEKVLPAARAALLDAFSFEARSFGQPVTRSEVIAVMQAVEGVTSVDLDFLYFTGQPKSLPPDLRLGARTAAWDGTETVSAELLNLNPTGIDLKGVKP
jgi:predicted phage baseplate assembly protein